MECTLDGSPGFKYGKTGTCYTHDGTDAGKAAAKKKAVRQAIAIGGGKAPKGLADNERELAEEALRELKDAGGSADDFGLVDVKRVPILAAGGPYFGKGSPEGGDTFDAAYLEEVAAANRELADELRVPLKIGHGSAQKLLANSGLAVDEMPAGGWLENFRVEGEGKRAKLYADLTGVPKKLATLMKKKLYRTRSVELSRVTSQTLKDGEGEPKKFKSVVTGLALLGAKAPAVRTLDDILAWTLGEAHEPAAELMLAEAEAPLEPDDLALFSASGARLEVEVLRFVDMAAGDVVWNPGAGMNSLRDEVSAALNPSPGPNSCWVMDVAIDASTVEGENAPAGSGRAIVQNYDANETWVVPFTRDDAGEVRIAPSSDWTLAEQAWVEAGSAASAQLAEAAARAGAYVPERRADTNGEMAEGDKKLTDEQVVALASAFGIEEEDEAKRREQVVAKLAEASAAETEGAPEGEKPAPPEGEKPEGEQQATVAMSQEEADELRATAAASKTFMESHRVERRDKAVDAAIDAGRLAPAKADEWKAFMDANEELATKMLAELPVDPELVTTYGVDDETGERRSEGDEEKELAMAEQLASMTVVPLIEGVTKRAEAKA